MVQINNLGPKEFINYILKLPIPFQGIKPLKMPVGTQIS